MTTLGIAASRGGELPPAPASTLPVRDCEDTTSTQTSDDGDLHAEGVASGTCGVTTENLVPTSFARVGNFEKVTCVILYKLAGCCFD